MAEFYTLVDKTPIAVDIKQWEREFGSRIRTISKQDEHDPWGVGDTKVGAVHISTVFLGLNLALCDPPLLFETMVFGGEHDRYQTRYSTWEQAEAGHDAVVKMVWASQLKVVK